MVFHTWIPGSTAPAPKVPRRLQQLTWNGPDAVNARLPTGAARPVGKGKHAKTAATGAASQGTAHVSGSAVSATHAAPVVPMMTRHDRDRLLGSAVSPTAFLNDTASSERLRGLMARPCAKPTPIIRRHAPLHAGASVTPEPGLTAPGRPPRKLRPMGTTPEPRRAAAGPSPGDLDAARIELSTPTVKCHFAAGPTAAAAAKRAVASRAEQQRQAGAGREGCGGDTPPSPGSVGRTSPAAKASAPPSVKSPVGKPTAPHRQGQPLPLESGGAPPTVVTPAAVLRGWPSRHLPAESGVPGASVRPIADPVCDTLFYACGCRRPVGDVALCAHAQVHYQVRRWNRTLQRLVDDEAAAWSAMAIATRDAALAQLQREHDRRSAAGPPGPPLKFRAGSITVADSGAGGGGPPRRRSSMAALPSGLTASASSQSLSLGAAQLSPGHGGGPDGAPGGSSRRPSNPASRGVTPGTGAITPSCDIGGPSLDAASEEASSVAHGDAGVVSPVSWSVA